MGIETNSHSQPTPLRVGVFGSAEHQRRPRLFAALEAAYPVRFEAREIDEVRELDAVLTIGTTDQATNDLPSMRMEGEETSESTRRAVALADDMRLSRALRGAKLSEDHATALSPSAARDGEQALATLDGSPAWVADSAARRHRVGSAPAELDTEEALRERLQPGRCLALLALSQFLRDLTERRRWQAPPPRAAFVIDDPNLHWPSYGHIRYTELLRNAAEHGYHVTIAMVPFDGWMAHPAVKRQFRQNAEQVSVCVHGNDHYGPELGAPRSPGASAALAEQALRRSASFQRRTGVRIDRVMVPPHERLCEPVAQALLGRGFEAVCTTRPYPWMATSADMPWLTRPTEAGPLAGWESTDVAAGGIPILLRADLAHHPREDLVLRAFLGQPLILYGHHDMLAGGPEALAQAASDIDAVGDVRWSSLTGIARAAIETRWNTDASGANTEAMEIRMRARHVRIEVPDGARELLIDTSALALQSDARVRLHTAEDSGATDYPIESITRIPLAAAGPIEIELAGTTPLPTTPSPPRRLRPALRRLASEVRDRAQGVTGS
jgi:hypothetical protein